MYSFARLFQCFTISYYHTDHFAGSSLLAMGRKPVVGPDHRYRTHVAHNDYHTPALRGTHDRGCHDVRQGIHQEVGRLLADIHLHADGVM